MSDVAYRRVSTADQKTDRQLDGLSFDRTFEDHCSGKDTNRPALTECLAYLREGDKLHVHSIDRLARNLADLEHVITDLTGRGISIIFHKECLTFTADASSPMNTLLLHMLGAVAQFERSMIRERQREGIRKAVERGAYSGANHKGRKSVCSDDGLADIRKRIESGEKVLEIAKELGISRQALYKKLKQD